MPSPLERPFVKKPFSYIKVAEIPSILGSEKNSIFPFSKFKKLLIFFKKSVISFLSKAFDKDITLDANVLFY